MSLLNAAVYNREALNQVNIGLISYITGGATGTADFHSTTTLDTQYPTFIGALNSVPYNSIPLNKTDQTGTTTLLYGRATVTGFILTVPPPTVALVDKRNNVLNASVYNALPFNGTNQFVIAGVAIMTASVVVVKTISAAITGTSFMGGPGSTALDGGGYNSVPYMEVAYNDTLGSLSLVVISTVVVIGANITGTSIVLGNPIFILTIAANITGTSSVVFYYGNHPISTAITGTATVTAALSVISSHLLTQDIVFTLPESVDIVLVV